jgi:hypothetical protein
MTETGQLRWMSCAPDSRCVRPLACNNQQHCDSLLLLLDTYKTTRQKQATCAQLGVRQSYVLARGGPPGVMATSGAAGQPDAPPEGLTEVTVPSLHGAPHRSGATDMSF